MATPLTGTRPAASRDPSASGDRRLRLDDILKLMVADGLVPRAGGRQARARADQAVRAPARAVAAQHWKSAKAPHVPLTLEWLVEWLAGKLGVPYRHIDPLKIDLTAVTQTMSNAYAERFRILPVAVAGNKLTVATAEPFVTSWAKELGPILKMDVELEFANPVDIRRFLGEFYNLARSMKKASEAQPGRSRSRGTSSSWSSSASAAPSTRTTATSSTSPTGCGNTRSSSARRTSTSSRAATSASCASASTACCTRSTRSRRRC
jgi:hypothetical protein